MTHQRGPKQIGTEFQDKSVIGNMFIISGTQGDLPLLALMHFALYFFNVCELQADTVRQSKHGLPGRWETPTATPLEFLGYTPSA